MIHGVLTTDDLLAATGYDRPADLCRALDKQGVRYLKGKGGKPWTTVGLIEAAVGLVPQGQGAENQLLSPDDA